MTRLSAVCDSLRYKEIPVLTCIRKAHRPWLSALKPPHPAPPRTAKPQLLQSMSWPERLGYAREKAGSKSE